MNRHEGGTYPALRIVEVSGSPRERGRAHGEELRATIAEGLGRWFHLIEAAVSTAGDAYASSLLAATDFVPAIETFTPALLEEVHGIAEGARQPFDTMLAYQLMDEEWWYRVGVMRSRKDAVEACSAVGVVRDDGTSIVAQNMDLPSYYDGSQVLLHIIPSGAPEALVFAPAGMIGSTGLNRDAVAVCCNAISQLSHRPTGLPVAFAVRAILAQRNVEDATTLVRSIPHATGQNYLLGGPGSVCSLEASARQVREVAREGAQVTHTNHPLANDDIDPAAPVEVRSTTRERLDRLRANLSFLGDRVTVQDIERTLSDQEVPVCVPRGSDWMTLGSLVMELSADPALHIAPGPPAQTPYTTVRFS